MNVPLLIDSIVRQTTVLIAQLATAGGLRAPLAHVATQVFLDLARELESQGVSRKVTADMFGLALRTYQRRTQRLAESATDRGRSLWEAVFAFISEQQVATREEILRRFRRDDERSVGGVLRDLVESQLLFSTGRGPSTVYRPSTADEFARIRRREDQLGLDTLVWSVIFREGPLTMERLAGRCQVPPSELAGSVERLTSAGRIERLEAPDGSTYRSNQLDIGFEQSAGWEAAVLDHFTALVRTVCAKLQNEPRARRDDRVGGSTYHFAVWPGHPFEGEVLDQLTRARERHSELRKRVDAYNAEKGLPPRWLKVVCYHGQYAVDDGNEVAEENEDA